MCAATVIKVWIGHFMNNCVLGNCYGALWFDPRSPTDNKPLKLLAQRDDATNGAHCVRKRRSPRQNPTLALFPWCK